MKNAIRASLAAALLAGAAAHAQTAISVDAETPIGTIRPEIYGQFVEHLGTQIYGDGIWVGEDSDIPNTGGIRDDVFAALEALDIPVMRWPGGCFADLYHWRDGIGPRDERVGRVNMVWGNTPESNQFGTHEFFDLAERLGAKTYLNINLGSGTVREAMEWLEYISFDGESALAQERRDNGREAPWRVDYITVGNETWGCGGRMLAPTYADHYTRWMTFLRTGGEQPVRILSGSHDGNLDYSAQLLEHPQIQEVAEGVSLHYYTLPTGDWSAKGAAIGFPEAEWATTMQRALAIDTVIEEQLALLEAAGAGPDFDLYVDEWGMWVDGEEGAPALYQQSSIRDAVVAGLSLNVFHTHADRVAMTNIAQMVNVLQAMILTDGPDMLLTPTYHVYRMYRPFQGAEALPVTLDGPDYMQGEVTVPALSVSAARTEDGTLVLSLVNLDPSQSHEVSLSWPGISAVEGEVLTGDAMDAHNTFDAPDRVRPHPADVSVEGDAVSASLPPHSVSVWRIRS